MRRSLSALSLLAIVISFVAVPSRAVDFLPLLLKKPEPTLLDPRGCAEGREGETGLDAALLWRRMTLLDEHGRSTSAVPSSADSR